MGKKFNRVVPANMKVSELNPLNIKCGSTKCDDNLHCFSRYMKSAEKKFGKIGICHNCGIDSIDWDRLQKKNSDDTEYIFDSLNKELIRNVFWNTKIEDVAIYNAKKKSRSEIREEAKTLLSRRVGKLNTFIDGRQTPLGKENIVNYAQHATATCCRKCMDAWYKIPKENELTEVQLEFCTDLVMSFVDEKLKMWEKPLK
jgi:hypothetical protein